MTIGEKPPVVMINGEQYPESFADYPQTLNEAKSDKSGSARDWTPREAIIAMLRRIDSGELTDLELAVVTVRCKTDDGLGKTAYFSSSPSFNATLGALELTKLFMWRDANQ